MNARRKFLKGIGLWSSVAAGAATPFLANTGASSVVRNTTDTPVACTVDPSLAPLGQTNLMLTADNRPPPPPVTTFADSSYVMTCATSIQPQTTLSIGGNFINRCPEDQLNRVAMAVGKDNRLWIEVDGTWRRVALEV